MSETTVEVLVSLTLLAPLAGAVVLLSLGRRIGEPGAGVLATAIVGGSFAMALVASADFITGEAHSATVAHWFEWLPPLGVEAAFRWDALAALMTLVVTGVGSLIHLYSIGYMHGDERFPRFFAYLNLFIFSMLTLVLADNFALLFVGWELVGLSSYLLISFWFERETAAAAGKKAFVTNRVGDVGFMVALMLIFAEFGTFGYDAVFETAEGVLSTEMATAITLLLLVGAAGKSAQLPLYVWLPDAMEGPTPVSALIHAATMVTAGVYMVARAGALFELAPVSGGIVATVGAVTALFAATIAIFQNDIKRVLAYSTISQLGYMFLAVGAAAYVAGIFHLMTHAFFKALLFLGAGSVIHAMHEEQDMRKMGGLARKMPITAVTMGIAWLAISGIPPLSGFWSKDEILAVVWDRGDAWVALWVVGIVTALLTAFYMSRLIFMTFAGRPRWKEGLEPHESPPVMTFPLVVLAVLSAVAGFVNLPWQLGLEHFLEPAFELVTLAHPAEGSTAVVLALVSVAAAAVGILVAAERYGFRTTLPSEDGAVASLLGSGYHVDDLYARVFVGGGGAVAEAAAEGDRRIVDGGVNGVGWLTQKAGELLRPLQTGYARSAALWITIGTVGLLAWFLSRGAF
ncbi:MAG: NADH-quinone oxidoreductase subunit L [Acidimicrobiia bacterium]|nr:NADH-quinone oxidoreductase subunit L [Acidimicrobiia bacterium]